jgi:CDP-6-deoxy-D-xylo-4-hexulose-3-dehydrase
LNAAFGLEQLKRLKDFAKKRQENFAKLMTFFKEYEQWFQLPIQDKRTKNNWLSFPLTIKPGAPFTRHEITKFLEGRNIQTRPIFTGNVLRQPAFMHLATRAHANAFPVSDQVMENGFLLGAHHGMTAVQSKHLSNTLEEFLDAYA